MFTYRSACFTIIIIVFSINCIRSEVKNETINNSDFFTENFKALRQKYVNICNKTSKSGASAGITYDTVKILLKTCVIPELESLKKHLNKPYRRKKVKEPEIPDYLYPDHYNKVIDRCFRNKVANFCYRTKEGKLDRDPHNQPVDEGVKCAVTTSIAYRSDLKELYFKHADTIKIFAMKQLICIYDFVTNLEVNDGKYVPPN